MASTIRCDIVSAEQEIFHGEATLVVATADHDHTLLLNGYTVRTGKTTPTNPGVLGLATAFALAVAVLGTATGLYRAFALSPAEGMRPESPPPHQPPP